jgi:hypothetical protein
MGKSKIKALVWVLVFLVLAAWFVGGSKAFQSCIYEAQNQTAEQPAKEGSAKFVSILNLGSNCTGEFVHKNSEAIIAIFTVILGIATILLWAATKALVTGGRRYRQKAIESLYLRGPKIRF